MSLKSKRHVEMGEKVGWRVWYINTYRGVALGGSFKRSALWKPGVNITKLPPANGFIPQVYMDYFPERNDEFWGSGFHAFKEKSDLDNYIQRYCSDVFLWVIGKAYLWGDVIECIHGYRASHASVKSLDVIYGHSWLADMPNYKLLEKLRKDYLLNNDDGKEEA